MLFFCDLPLPKAVNYVKSLLGIANIVEFCGLLNTHAQCKDVNTG